MNNKFTERDIGSYISNFYQLYKSDPNQTFLFDFSKYERISNQNLLLLSSLIKYLYLSEAKFKITLFESDLNAVNKKQARTIIQLWEIWKLYDIFNKSHFENYIDNFNNLSITFLKDKYKINLDNQIFNRLGITPFVTLNFINEYKDEKLIETEIEPIFTLNEIILEELNSENSTHPFLEQTLSSIITRELYENFLDHYQSSFFNTSIDMSFMSISLRRKLSIYKYFLKRTFLYNFIQNYNGIIPTMCKFILKEIENKDKFIFTFYIEEFNDLIFNEIDSKKDAQNLIESFKKEDFDSKQYLLKKTFKEEELQESESFFKDKIFKNVAYIQYTFIDFGRGIPTTLFDEYCKENEISKIDLFNQPDHHELLKYAFKHYTSRFPITDKFGNTDKIIPRGLFDILTIVQRYQGLLIVRSNSGRILYNFSDTNDIDKAVKVFGNQNDIFPGTYITLYIPELSNKLFFDKSAIRIIEKTPKKKGKPRNINLFNLIGSEFVPKEELYNNLISKLKTELTDKENLSHLNYISFFGISDIRIIIKTIYFLLTNYEINKNNSVLIMHPPNSNIVNYIREEIKALDRTVKNFRIHPLPLIRFLPEENNIEIDWLGVYDQNDINKLSQLLFEEYSLSLSDFNDPYNIKGNVITSDKYGNIKGTLPNREILLEYYRRHTTNLISEAINNNHLLKSNGLYLCNGNYYQNEFLQLSELLDNSIYRDVLSKALYEQILFNIISEKNISEENAVKYLYHSKKVDFIGKNRDIKFIAVTSSCHKILKSFFQQGFVYKTNANENDSDGQYIKFDNYLDIDSSEKFDLFDENTDYIILCDAISTGNLVIRLNELIANKENSELLYIATFVSNIDLTFENSKEFVEKYSSKMLSLLDLPIEKKRTNDLNDSDFKKTLIRINPFTNLPIEFNEASSLIDSILILENLEFLNYIDEEDIKIKFEIHNNLIHPFYFNFGSILEKENLNIKDGNLAKSLVYYLLVEKNKFDFNKGNYAIFYPKDSGVDFLDKNEFISKITLNHNIQFYELDRFPTESGWKFPHSSIYFTEVIKAKPNVLIIDDGTCSGNSLYQIINELSYFEPKKIDLLCIISRIDDYKREFLSRLKLLRKHSEIDDDIEVNIYYGTQWHLPTFYLSENPYSEEIKWLNQILELRNIPQFIRNNASKILETIEPKTNKSEEYRYFPKDRITKKIPKKDIILTRNEIGKIAGYRFYKESFKWYDAITFKKRKDIVGNKEENKQIELLAMCLLYEPYLYSIISKSFPDIRVHLELFVENIFFEINGKKINLETDLHYDWSGNKKDLIHLFFLVFRENKFLLFLEKHINVLSNFIEFAGDSKSALNYVLFKLSFYFTSNGKLDSKISSKIKSEIIKRLMAYESSKVFDGLFTAEIKQFRHFVSTLKTDYKWEVLVSDIRTLFDNIRPEKEEFHDNNLVADKQVILAQLIEICSPYLKTEEIKSSLNYINSIYEKNIKVFIQKVLSLAETYPKYFIAPDDYKKIQIGDKCLRTLDGLISNNIQNFEKSNSKIIIEALNSVFDGFIYEKTFLYQVINDFNTLSFKKIIDQIKNEVDLRLNEIDLKSIRGNYESFDESIELFIPKEYFMLALKEFFNNMRHSDGRIKISFSSDKTNLFIVSINGVNTKAAQNTGNGKGSLLLSNLSKNEVFNCDYTKEKRLGLFVQKLKFKKLNK